MRTAHILGMFSLAACSTAEPADDRPGAGKNDSAAFEGQILITEFQQSELHSSQRGASAFFSDRPLPPSEAEAGDCILVTQPVSPGAKLSSAGTIEITGTVAPLTLEPMGTEGLIFYDSIVSDDLFEPGAILSVSASGAEVPAFSGEVTAPATLEDVQFPTSISRSKGATVTWTAADSSGMWLTIVAEGRDTRQGLLCRTDDTGTYQLSPEVVALISAGATEATAIDLTRFNDTVVTPDDAWNVTLRATSTHGSPGAKIEP
jgi:hypothetical protein